LNKIHIYGTLNSYNQICIWNNVNGYMMDTIDDGPITYSIDPIIYFDIFAQEWSPIDFFFTAKWNTLAYDNSNRL